ncbi:MAG: pimeloyl-ACP methyl ester carboxylesterase [Saprospiraceae bacterium]|jgi:pimeloyl-ACP methyl ester carboxylesterase
MLIKSSKGTAYKFSGLKNSPVVVLIHGLGLHHAIWDDYLLALETQFQVLSYDLLGHGASGPPPTLLDLSAFANQLKALLDELNIKRCAIVGFSLGGMINRRFAMDYPGRTWALAILNSPHERGPEAQTLVEKRATDTARGGPGANLNETIERWFTAEFRKGNDSYLEKIRAWVLANQAEYYAQSRLVLAKGVLELINPNIALAEPTLVISCENDSGSTPAMAHGIAAEIIGSQTHIVPNLQHMGLVEQPQQFINLLLAFLSSVKMSIEHEEK